MAAGNLLQTISSLSHIGTGEWYDRKIESVATAAETFSHNSAANESLEFSASALEVLIGTEADTLAYTATGSETVTFDVQTILAVTANGSESFLGSAITHSFSPPAAIASDELISSRTFNLSFSANASETFTINRPLALAYTATANEVITTDLISNYTQTEIATAVDSFVLGQSAQIFEVASAADSFVLISDINQVVAETASAAEVITNYALATELLADIVTGEESYSFEGSTSNVAISSVADASDNLWAKDFIAIAWVMNTQNGALTNYDNFGFNSIASHNGVLYATSPEGLFELGADDDAGRKIDAHSKSGFMDFGTEEKKHISDIYIGYTGGELECDVETYDGPEEVYTYPMEQRDADAPRNNRIKPGKGLSSRYWRFAFRNVDGANFQIHDIAVQLARSKRRL